MITMKVVGLTLDGNSNTPILVLQRADNEEILPIWVGAPEAMAISMAISDVKLERPPTHMLLLQTIKSMGGQITGASITTLKDGTFYASIEIVRGQEFIHVDCRPSDAIVLALYAEIAITVSPSVLQKASADRVSPNSTDAERRPSDMSDVHFRQLSKQISKQAFENIEKQAKKKTTGVATITVHNAGKITDEEQLQELLARLEPASKRMM